MGGLVFNIGSLSSPVVLFVCATYLYSQGYPEWIKFFNVGVFLGVWAALWSVGYSWVRHYYSARMDERARSSNSRSNDVMTAYFFVLLVCVFGTLIGGLLILRLV